MPGPALISAGVSVIGGLIGGGAARRRARAAARKARALQRKLTDLENNRQAIINPFDQSTNLASMAQDLSGQLSNPYANLGVATQAAEMKAEEADISLANTLDTLRATGAGAGWGAEWDRSKGHSTNAGAPGGLLGSVAALRGMGPTTRKDVSHKVAHRD